MITNGHGLSQGGKFSIDEGLELTGSVDRPLRPFVQTLDYRDDVVSPGDPVRIEGYNFDASTRVLVNGVEIPVTSVSSAAIHKSATPIHHVAQ